MQPERTITAIEVTSGRITFLVAPVVLRFRGASISHASGQFPFPIVIFFGHHAFGREFPQATFEFRVVHIAVLSGPVLRTEARVVPEFILARTIVLTRITIAFVVAIDFTMNAGRTRWTFALISAVVQRMAHTIALARTGVAIDAEELAISTREFLRAHARMAPFHLRTHTAVLARGALAKVHLDLAMPAHVTGATVAVEIVH